MRNQENQPNQTKKRSEFFEETTHPSPGVTVRTVPIRYEGKLLTHLEVRTLNVAEWIAADRERNGYRVEEAQIGDVLLLADGRVVQVAGIGPTSPQLTCRVVGGEGQWVTVFGDIRGLWRLMA